VVRAVNEWWLQLPDAQRQVFEELARVEALDYQQKQTQYMRTVLDGLQQQQQQQQQQTTRRDEGAAAMTTKPTQAESREEHKAGRVLSSPRTTGLRTLSDHFPTNQRQPLYGRYHEGLDARLGPRTPSEPLPANRHAIQHGGDTPARGHSRTYHYQESEASVFRPYSQPAAAIAAAAANSAGTPPLPPHLSQIRREESKEDLEEWEIRRREEAEQQQQQQQQQRRRGRLRLPPGNYNPPGEQDRQGGQRVDRKRYESASRRH